MVILAILLGLLPGIIWLLFYLREDFHPEPKRLLFYTFLAGASFSIFALAAQLILDYFFPGLGISTRNPTPFALVLLAGIEEVVKFAAAYAAIHKNPEFDEPVDAMIYMVVAALGFATVENIGAVSGLSYHVVFFGNVFETLSLRFVGATLIHTLASAIVGYFWAVSIRDFNLHRFVVWGLLLATILHACFNYLILSYESYAYPILLMLAAGFFVLNDFEKLNKKTL
ncbi:MAG: PrsW family intramembrane metalloprotease [Candidatus Liptonbacteria bacterium]|nr:PrsW family intramembrane metalloprotease [Candidatus Liptonbacteria bacterium]